MSVFSTGLVSSDEDFPIHGRLIAVPRDLEPHQGAYELCEKDEGAAVVFVVYHQGEPLDLTGYAARLLVDGVTGSPFELEDAPEAEPAADARKGEVRWVVPAEVTAHPVSFRAQLLVDRAGEVSRASNVIHFRVRARVAEEE
jgi:hypothetical protein